MPPTATGTKTELNAWSRGAENFALDGLSSVFES